MNIVAAQCFSWRDRTVVDVFTVSDPPEFLAPDELWARVAASVRGAMSGRLDLDWRIREKRNAPSTVKALEIEPEVAIHNAASDFHTVIEITAADRLGLLYDVGTALHGLGLSVGIAKIATYGDRVADVFYVREAGAARSMLPSACAPWRRPCWNAWAPIDSAPWGLLPDGAGGWRFVSCGAILA